MAACLSAQTADQGALAAAIERVLQELFSPTLAALQHLGPQMQGMARDQHSQAQALAEIQRGLQRLKPLLSYGSTWIGQAAATAATTAQPSYPSLGQFCTQVNAHILLLFLQVSLIIFSA